jgi:hypothetical protein
LGAEVEEKVQGVERIPLGPFLAITVHFPARDTALEANGKQQTESTQTGRVAHILMSFI